MNLNAARQYITHLLTDFYSENEIRHFYFLIVEKITGLTREQILANKNTELSETNIQKFETFIFRLSQSEPIQYILGEADFYRLKFKVDKNVLIPRPETEELVDWILQETRNKSGLKMLDIGTGSGCIAISLAKNSDEALVEAFDISEGALALAAENAKLNQVLIDFKRKDAFSSDFLTMKNAGYDMIVSNPPYICNKEKSSMESNVLNYEPNLAFFVSDQDPLVFYRQIALFAKKNLKENGLLFFEINQAFGKETVQLLSEIGFKDISLRKDFFGNDRMIKACL